MELELVTVGAELLLGFTVDSNAAEIAQAAAAVGAQVTRRVTVTDDAAAIRDAVSAALQRSGYVIVTGGLGPTRDDVTKRAVADLFGVPLELDRQYLAELEARFRRYRRSPMPASNRSQAEIPKGALRLPNPRGTAQGLVLEGPAGTAVLLPGVPPEMRAMLRASVVPLLERRVAASGGRPQVIHSLTLRTTGITESGLADVLQPLESAFGQMKLAFLPGWDGVDLRLTAMGGDKDAVREALEEAARRLISSLGSRCYGRDGEDLAGVVLDRLRDLRWTLASAESCTGGLVGARVTAITGASDVYVGGTVAYSNVAKVRDLGVPEAVIQREGAVSEPVAAAMAEGVARRFGADAAVAVTGVAGPSGGTELKPVGTVWLAARAGERRRTALLRLPGGREEVRHRSAQAALDLLRRLLEPSATNVPAT